MGRRHLNLSTVREAKTLRKLLQATNDRKTVCLKTHPRPGMHARRPPPSNQTQRTNTSFPDQSPQGHQGPRVHAQGSRRRTTTPCQETNGTATFAQVSDYSLPKCDPGSRDEISINFSLVVPHANPSRPPSAALQGALSSLWPLFPWLHVQGAAFPSASTPPLLGLRHDFPPLATHAVPSLRKDVHGVLSSTAEGGLASLVQPDSLKSTFLRCSPFKCREVIPVASCPACRFMLGPSASTLSLSFKAQFQVILSVLTQLQQGYDGISKRMRNLLTCVIDPPALLFCVFIPSWVLPYWYQKFLA